MVNKVIHYLLSISKLGLKFEGGDKLEIVINASFADDISDRKSLQAYAIRLFGGLMT